jgi:iron complex transport system substrate-binding protein
MFPPGRIVCLTEETVETLYLLGERDRIAGISGYVVRPRRLAVRSRASALHVGEHRQDPLIAAGSRPDVLRSPGGYRCRSHSPRDRGARLNQRTVTGILEMIRMVGAMVGASERAEELVETLETRLAGARKRAACLPKRPRVFFEEWDDPLISGIGWVSELVEVAGGIDIFADRRNQGAAKDRIVKAEEVVEREPDLIIGSWCGKKFRPERVAARPGLDRTPAVQRQELYEMESSLILQLGPAPLTDGLAELQRIAERWAASHAAHVEYVL